MNLVNEDGWTFEGEVMHQGQQVLHSSFFLLFFIVMPAGYTSLFTLRASMMLFLLFGQIWYLLLLMLLFLFIFFFSPTSSKYKKKRGRSPGKLAISENTNLSNYLFGK